jgi:hypothetical protein
VLLLLVAEIARCRIEVLSHLLGRPSLWGRKDC